jgi:hypothetical protein
MNEAASITAKIDGLNNADRVVDRFKVTVPNSAGLSNLSFEAKSGGLRACN